MRRQSKKMSYLSIADLTCGTYGRRNQSFQPLAKEMPPMNLANSVALVTGANRGLGSCLVAALLDAGAAAVYATSRAGTAGPHDDPRVRALALDVTSPASVAAAATAA